MTPAQRAMTAAGLLDALAAGGRTVAALEAVSLPLVEAGRGDLAQSLWTAWHGVSAALGAVADTVAQEATTDAIAHDLVEAPALDQDTPRRRFLGGHDPFPQEPAPETDEQRADRKWRAAHPEPEGE